jgi:hypothetical protein
MNLTKILATLMLVGAVSAIQVAPAALSTGTASMGVFGDGHLGVLGVGLNSYSVDAITPGCLCEGWGTALEVTCCTPPATRLRSLIQ